MSALGDAERSDLAESTGVRFFVSEPLGFQGFQEPNSDLTEFAGKLRFEEVNEATWKLTDGSGSNVPGCHGHWPAYRTTKAIGWLVGVGGGLWLARYRNKTSRPMTLRRAKKYLHEMVDRLRPGKRVADPIEHLNAAAIQADNQETKDGGAAPNDQARVKTA
jgi:hypothetical protein